MITDIDVQPAEEVHRARYEGVLSVEASVLWKWEYVTSVCGCVH